MKRRQVKGRIPAGIARRFQHHQPFIGKRLYGGKCRIGINIKEPGAFSPGFISGYEHVAIGGRLFQQVQNAGPGSHRIIGKSALMPRNPVGDIKADSRKITGDLVWMVPEHIDGGRAVSPENAAAVRQRNAVVLEKKHQAADRMMRFPGLGNLSGSGFADALDIGQFFRRGFDDHQGLIPEMADQAGNGFGAQPLDDTGLEVFSDAVNCRRQQHFEPDDLELLPKAGMRFPDAVQLQVFSGRGLRHEPHDRDRVPGAPGAKFCNGVMVFRIVECHAIQAAFQIGQGAGLVHEMIHLAASRRSAATAVG